MTDVSADMVKSLREVTGAGFLDCRKALSENNGDLEASVDWLRQKGIMKAGKKSDRLAAEGVISLFHGNDKYAILEVNSESDFVSKNDTFRSLVSDLMGALVSADLTDDASVNDFLKCDLPVSGKDISTVLAEAIARIGENIVIRRFKRVRVADNQMVFPYLHGKFTDSLGKIGVLTTLSLDTNVSDLDDAKRSDLLAFGKSLSMHVAASKPIAITSNDLDPNIVRRESDVLTEQVKESGKTGEMVDKIVQGKMRRFFEEVCLLEQKFIMDQTKKISDVLQEKSIDLGVTVSVSDFTRFEVGEMSSAAS